jgi:hypothetical protein
MRTGTPTVARGALGLRRAWVAVAVAVSVAGCFGYNPPAKRWAYVGNAVLVAGGGGALAADLLTGEDAPPCSGRSCPYEPPVGGALITGAVLVTAGIVGIVLNATRRTVKTSR